MDTQNIPENDQEKEQLDNQNTGTSGSAPAGNPPQGVPYGQNPNLYGQNNYPYGQNPNPYGQNNYPYGQNNYPYGQNNYPYGQNNYPYGQNNYPYGQNNYPYGQNNYPYGQNGVYYTPSYRPSEPKSPFAMASMILGICSLITVCTVFLPIPLGALGALFFILSRKKGKKPDTTAVAGLATSIGGIALGAVIWVIVFVSAFNMFKPENRDLLNERFEEMYGMDFEEYLREVYGIE